MKNTFFLVVLTCSLVACSSDDAIEAELIGQFKLIEVLADPGDGSGTFQAVNSDKIIEFHQDGKVTSNGSLCSMGIEAIASSTGTYSIENATISTTDCSNLSFVLNGNELIISYPCIEPCKAKFIKL